MPSSYQLLARHQPPTAPIRSSVLPVKCLVPRLGGAAEQHLGDKSAGASGAAPCLTGGGGGERRLRKEVNLGGGDCEATARPVGQLLGCHWEPAGEEGPEGGLLGGCCLF
jgi:hypothetical protein